MPHNHPSVILTTLTILCSTLFTIIVGIAINVAPVQFFAQRQFAELDVGGSPYACDYWAKYQAIHQQDDMLGIFGGFLAGFSVGAFFLWKAPVTLGHSFDVILQHLHSGSNSAKAGLSVSVANALRDAGRNDEARNFYNKALGFDRGDFHALWSLGGMEIDAARYSKATDYFEEAFRNGRGATPQETTYLLDHWGWAILQNGQIDKAKSKWEEAIRFGESQDTYVAKARYNLALLLEQNGQLKEAGQLMEKARQEAEDRRNSLFTTDPEEATRAMFDLSLIETHRKNYEEALGYVEQAAARNPMWGRYACTDRGLEALRTHNFWKHHFEHAFPNCPR